MTVMLTQLDVANFQSLGKVSIPLGKFTAVTGPTGSGKSALLRALGLLAFNAPGTAYIRQGQSSCKVASGDQGQGWAVGVTRAKTRGKDSYRLVHAPQSGDEPHVEEYTKLAGKVPGDVTSALQLTRLNFAGQFDSPFLLTETGSEIARVLGELTNVTIVLDSAREAGRRRKGFERDLKGAEQRLEALEDKAQEYVHLKDQRAALSEAESALESAAALEARLELLQAWATQADAQRAIAERASEVADSWEKAADLTGLDSIGERLQSLRALVAAWDQAEADGTLWSDRERVARRAEGDAHEAIHAALVAAGQCPLCGQAVDATAGS
jgi:DNA repair exonuclease SbcCD ATPase subunit